MSGNGGRGVQAEPAGVAEQASLGDLVLNVGHVAIAVEDLATAISWYERLGFNMPEHRVTEGEHWDCFRRC
jgi:catechol-2,3-dioxygenase